MPKSEKIKFGSHFEINKGNRLDPLKREDAVPDYVQFAREDLRGALKLSESESWPNVPKGISGVEGLFGEVRKAVDARWREKVMPLLKTQCAGWLKELSEAEIDSEVKALLADPERLEVKMEMRQFGILEPIRQILPEAWRTLLLASSERQAAEIALFRRWVKQLPKDEVKGWGMSKSELEWFSDIPALLGKYIDHGYLKQVELADRPGGSLPTELAGVLGADRVYNIHRDDAEQSETLPYIDVFPFELGRFSGLLLELKRRVEAGLSDGRLPATYTSMPSYLEKMASLYSSREVSPDELFKLWSRDLSQEANRLSEEGCPVVLIPQSTSAASGDADKVDVEIRLGLRTDQIRKTERMSNGFRDIAQGIVAQERCRSALAEPEREIPPVTLTFQPFAFGPNLYWMTRGESTKEKILSHTNAVADVARQQEIPLLEKVFSSSGIELDAYSRSAVQETILHEFGHGVMTKEDSGVKERMGDGSAASLMEELKAETVGSLLLDRFLDQGEKGVDATTQLMAKLGTVCDYLANKSDNPEFSGGQYFYAGIRMMHDLLHSGAIGKGENGKFVIHDAREGVRVIARIGEEVLGHYTNPSISKDVIDAFAQKTIAMKEYPLVREFVEAVKAK